MRKIAWMSAVVWILFATGTAAWALGKKPPVVELGQKPPEISFQKPDNSSLSLEEVRVASPGKMTVVCFLSYECPLSRMVVKSASKFFDSQKEKVTALGISPMPYETGAMLSQYAKEQKTPFDLVLDESGELTYLFQIKEVPTFFVFDSDGVLQFRGGVGGMKNAVVALEKGEKVTTAETEITGCAIPKRKVNLGKLKKKRQQVKKNGEKRKLPIPSDTTAQKGKVKKPKQFSRRWGK